jgi:membrane protease YdiL (CAAX protease family)
MIVAEDSDQECVPLRDPVPTRRSVWDLIELVIGYGLILAVIWTPKPLQRWLYLGTVAWFILSILSSFPGWKSMGCSLAGFWRSLWVVGVALVFAVTTTMLASNLHTLHQPGGPIQWISTFAGYTVFALAQQFLLQGYFLIRLLRILPNGTLAAVAAASVFALAHLPNPILTPVTLLWGLVASLVFLKSRNIYPLAIAHAIFGICLAVTIPGPVLHNMRVGLGYLNYHAPRRTHLSQIDHRVSTDAWVRAEAPTRR